MPNLNKVQLMGNLTRDPETRHTPKGTAVTSIGLATSRSWKGEDGQKQEETTFVDITFFGRVGEIVGQYCQKGKPLYVEGRLKLEQWEDKNTGQQRSKLSVVGDNIQLLGGRPENAASRPAPAVQTGMTTREAAQAVEAAHAPAGAQEDDDIPF